MFANDVGQILPSLPSLPSFELYYGKFTNNKIYNADINMAIPKGIKYLAWFTVYKTDNICVFIETDNTVTASAEIRTKFKKKTHIIKHNNHIYGTILYGTVFKSGSTKCFSVEDIIYSDGRDVNQSTYLHKLSCMKTELTKIINPLRWVSGQDPICVGLPIIDATFQGLIKKIDNLEYTIESIQFRFSKRKQETHPEFIRYYKRNIKTLNSPKLNSCTKTRTIESKPQTDIFKVVADINCDTYMLYKNNAYVDIAHIPTFNTSVMMNKIFRYVKENNNIDLLEESDDEDDFENVAEDKFLNTEVNDVYMKCVYLQKFKRWAPCEVASAPPV